MVEIDNIESTYLQHKIENLLGEISVLLRAEDKEMRSKKALETLENLFPTPLFSVKKDRLIDLSFDTIENRVNVDNLHELNFDWNQLKEDNEEPK